MSLGSVKWFNREKGYGFIVPDDGSVNGGKDVFVHYTQLSEHYKDNTGRKQMNEGDRVEFVGKQTERGYVATEVAPEL